MDNAVDDAAGILDLVSSDDELARPPAIAGAPDAPPPPPPPPPPGRPSCVATPQSAAKLRFPRLFRDDSGEGIEVRAAEEEKEKDDHKGEIGAVVWPAAASGAMASASRSLRHAPIIDLGESPVANACGPSSVLILDDERDGVVEDLITPDPSPPRDCAARPPSASLRAGARVNAHADAARAESAPESGFPSSGGDNRGHGVLDGWERKFGANNPGGDMIDDDDDDDGDEELLNTPLPLKPAKATPLSVSTHSAEGQHNLVPRPKQFGSSIAGASTNSKSAYAGASPEAEQAVVTCEPQLGSIAHEASADFKPAHVGTGAVIERHDDEYATIGDGADLNALVPDMSLGASGEFSRPLFELDSHSALPNLSHEAMVSLLNVNNENADATSELETPPALTVPLMIHQRRALHWMVRREVTEQPPSHPNGGILADDQGFGKTLSTISLLLTNTPPADHTGNRTPWGTLIVTPISTLAQWEQEFSDRIAGPYRPTVYIHHGPNRTKNPHDLVRYDVVLTTYSILVQEYPKFIKEKNTRRRKGTLFRLKWFRVVLDEAHAIKNRRSEAFAAAFEIKTDRRWALTGTPLQNSVDDIYSLFIFLRYIIVSSHTEWRTRWKKRMESRNARERERTFKQFQTVLGVVLLRRAKHDKIDGRPVIELPPREVRVVELNFSADELDVYRKMEQNAVTSLQKFAADGGIMANYMNVLLLLLRLRQVCSHPSLCHWTANAGYVFSDAELDAVDNAMRGDKAKYLSLPEDVRNRLVEELGPDSIVPQSCPVCMDIVEGNDGVVTPCGHIFCRSDYDGWTQNHRSCPSCRSEFEDFDSVIDLEYVRKEIHAIHRQRMRTESVVLKESKPIVSERKKIELFGFGATEPPASKKRRLESSEDARKESAVDETKDVADSTEGPPSDTSPRKRFVQSAKIKALLHELEKMMKEGDDKALVFSQWTRMLDLISVPLMEQGIRFERLDGSMNSEARTAAISEFKKRSDIRVFLISLKAGGVGLNLTAANRVMMMDCWWNPAVEDQAIDRVHRIGQKKPVSVIRFKIENTVEDRIYELQDKKRMLMEGALGVEGLQTMGRRRLDLREIMSLFGEAAQHVADMAQDSANELLAQAASAVLRMSAGSL